MKGSKKIKIYLFIFIVAIFSSSILHAQSQKITKTRILFLLDASGSMYAQMEESNRINIAKRLLIRLSDSLTKLENVEIALRVYGHQSMKQKRNCRDTKLEVPFGELNQIQIRDKIKNIKPKGTTLIAYSLQEAAYDFPRDPSSRNIIILITDGIEECDGDPCAVSLALQKQGVILKPFIIGLGKNAKFRNEFDCVGQFFEAKTEKDFQNVLNIVISQALNNTTLQVNLLDAYGRPTETDVTMTFYENHSKKMVNNFVHTLNYRGLPDTFYLDPSIAYDIEVHSTPKIERKNYKLTAGKHNTLALDAPQGKLNLVIDGITNYNNLQALILHPKTNEIIHVQSFNDIEKYLVGIYTLEILSLPRIRQENVSVKQSKTTTIQIPQPGKLSIVKRKNIVGGIYHKKDNKMLQIFSFNEGASEEVVLQPGKYYIITRSGSNKSTLETQIREINIKSGRLEQIAYY